MRPAAQIAETIALLDDIFQASRPADAVVSAHFRNRRYIGAKDRQVVAERVYAVLRHHARLGWWLTHLGWAGEGADGARPRMLALLALVERLPADRIAALFDGSQYAPPELTAAEQPLVGALAGQQLAPPEMPAAVRLELPDWALAPFERALGDRLEVELAALSTPAPFDLRVNELKGNRDEALATLRAGDIGVAPTPWSPLGIRVQGRPPLAGHPLFKSGGIEVQDEGSQLVALLVDVAPGMQVADFCAGAGGKSLAMAARMGGRGRVVACDTVEGRLIRARERMRRAGVDNIEPRLLESERDRWIKKQKGKFDRVLVDAPCTGTGAWRRNPDARWRPTDLERLTTLQSSILASAARLTKPGGRLVYATCSLLREENEDRVAAFLESAPDFTVRPVAEIWPTAVGGAMPPGEGPYLRLSPATTATDGFFAAVLERAGRPEPDPVDVTLAP